jgi:hypothetical protein
MRMAIILTLNLTMCKILKMDRKNTILTMVVMMSLMAAGVLGTKGEASPGPGQANVNAAGNGTAVQARMTLRDCIGDNETDKADCMQQVKAQARGRVVDRMQNNCNKLGKEANQQKCMNRVNGLEECWAKAPGLERAACARERIMGNEGVKKMIQECKSEDNQTECTNEVKAKVKNYAAVRFQGLNERAEELIAKGVSEEIISGFSDDFEALQQRFNDAEDTDSKKQVLAEIRQRWTAFMGELKQELQDGE